MNDLITLLKYDLINSYNINSILNRKNKKEKYKILSFLILMIFAGISFEISMFSYFNLMVEPLKSIDMLYIIAIQGFMISIFIILGTSIYKSPGLLFGMKDFEFLITKIWEYEQKYKRPWTNDTQYIDNVLGHLEKKWIPLVREKLKGE